jgi:hypothetical protein
MEFGQPDFDGRAESGGRLDDRENPTVGQEVEMGRTSKMWYFEHQAVSVGRGLSPSQTCSQETDRFFDNKFCNEYQRRNLRNK